MAAKRLLFIQCWTRCRLISSTSGPWTGPRIMRMSSHRVAMLPRWAGRRTAGPGCPVRRVHYASEATGLPWATCAVLEEARLSGRANDRCSVAF